MPEQWFITQEAIAESRAVIVSEVVAREANDHAVEGSLPRNRVLRRIGVPQIPPRLLRPPRLWFLLSPRRHSPRSPRRSRRFHIFLKLCQIDVNECPQLPQLLPELGRTNVV
jgi:hypothetical protein